MKMVKSIFKKNKWSKLDEEKLKNLSPIEISKTIDKYNTNMDLLTI